jgi:hypothetical protein
MHRNLHGGTTHLLQQTRRLTSGDCLVWHSHQQQATYDDRTIIIHDGVTETRLTVANGEVSFTCAADLYFGQDEEGPVIASDPETARLFLGQGTELTSATRGSLPTVAFEIDP